MAGSEYGGVWNLVEGQKARGALRRCDDAWCGLAGHLGSFYWPLAGSSWWMRPDGGCLHPPTPAPRRPLPWWCTPRNRGPLRVLSSNWREQTLQRVAALWHQPRTSLGQVYALPPLQRGQD